MLRRAAVLMKLSKSFFLAFLFLFYLASGLDINLAHSHNQWVSIGPDGGYVSALAINPQTPGTLYAGTSGSVLFKSTNGGANWNTINAGLTNTDIFSLAIDPQTPGTIYARTEWGGAFNIQQAATILLPGDCNGDGQTTIEEVQKSINQFLGISQVQSCCDLNGNGQVTIDEVQQVINAFLGIKGPYEFEAVTISPFGGIYYLSNGIVLEVPEGAVSELVTVRLRGVREEEVMPILQSYGLTEKYFMAAYEAQPKGFRFNKPINIYLQSEPPTNSTALLFLFDVDLTHGIYSPGMLGSVNRSATFGLIKNGALIETDQVIETKYIAYDCKNNQMQIKGLTDFYPFEGWVQVVAAIVQILDPSDCVADPCRCCTIKVVSKDSDYIIKDKCVNVTSSGTVQFLDCKGQPVEGWNLEETDIGAVVIEKTPEKDTIWCNEQLVLSVGVKDARGNSIPEYELTVTTQNTDIVEIKLISKNLYYIKGIGPGKATIKVDPGCGKAENITITVNAVDSIELIPREPTIMVNEILLLDVIARDKFGNVLYGYSLNWTVQQAGSIISFDPVFRIARGLGEGTAIITAATNESCDGVKSGTSTIHVIPPVDKVEVTPSPASVLVGGTLQLIATPKDKDGNVLTGLPVSWVSSNTAIATVDQKGLVTGVSAGTTTITATVEGVIGTAIVTVSDNAVQLTFSLSAIPDCHTGPNGVLPTLFVNVGDTMQLIITAKTEAGNVTQAGFYYEWTNTGTPLEPLKFPISPCGLITYTGAYSYSPQTAWGYCAYIHRLGDSPDTVPLATCSAVFGFDWYEGPVQGYCPWPEHFGCVPGWAFCHNYSYWWRNTPCSK